MQTPSYHFIGNPTSGETLDELRALSWDEGTVMCTRQGWVWPAYCRLKMAGADTSFGFEPLEGAINLVHGPVARQVLQPVDFRTHFIIGIRADYRHFPYGHFEIVQNRHTAGGRRIYMPHLPQPGLIPRDPTRRGVKTVCFSGRAQNSIDLDRLATDLEALGCRMVYRAIGEWQDLHDVDVLLGIRSFSKNPYYDKPPTKLFNAWLAGVPFIGGCDSAYEQVAVPEKEYLRVGSYGELMAALRRLTTDDGLYDRLVTKGFQAAKSCSAEKTTEHWKAFLDGAASEAYRKWARGDVTARLRSAFGAAAFAAYEQGVRVAASRLLEPLRGR